MLLFAGSLMNVIPALLNAMGIVFVLLYCYLHLEARNEKCHVYRNLEDRASQRHASLDVNIGLFLRPILG